jgi:2'-5' RNA ligase
VVGANERTRRLFVAVPLPQSSIPFAVVAQELLPRARGLRLVPREQMHCTIAFIGQAGSQKTEAAMDAVNRVPADSGGDVLFEEVMRGFEAAGVMRREKRPFRAHATLARLKAQGMMQPTSDCGRAVFGVESVCLYESQLSRSGAVYKVLAQKDLQRACGPKRA